MKWSTAEVHAREDDEPTTTMPAAHFARKRCRPAGTSAYAIPTSVTASEAIGRDGIEKPSQSVRISTPKGRGRPMRFAIWNVTSSTAIRTPRKTSRCRHRRNAIEDEDRRPPQRAERPPAVDPVDQLHRVGQPVVAAPRDPRRGDARRTGRPPRRSSRTGRSPAWRPSRDHDDRHEETSRSARSRVAAAVARRSDDAGGSAWSS